MISYIRGPLVELIEDTIIVEAGNIGYQIRVPLSLLEQLPKAGSVVMIYTYFQIREDGANLYGFLNRQDLLMFKQLIGVNGIGPKGALGILSALRPDELRLAIISGDAKAIARAPGIGAKTAQRVILDLKDKIQIEDMLPSSEEVSSSQGAFTGQAGKEAIEALMALGYSNLEAAKAVKRVEITEDMSAEDVLKASLRHLV